MHKWKYVVQLIIVDEWNIFPRHQSCTPVIELIKTTGLIRTLEMLACYTPKLMQELIVNLLADLNDPSSED